MEKHDYTYNNKKNKTKPAIAFRISALFWITILIFAACFGAYMLNVNAHPEEYFAKWAGENKAAGGNKAAKSDTKDKNTANVINPVPLAKTAENEKYLNSCVFVGVMQFAEFKDIIKPIEISNLDKDKNVYVRELSEAEIKQIKNLKPKKIYIIGDIPVKGDNSETDAKNRETLALADSLNVHYLDINTAFKDNNGAINVKYINIDGSLNELGIAKYKEYILNHTVK